LYILSGVVRFFPAGGPVTKQAKLALFVIRIYLKNCAAFRVTIKRIMKCREMIARIWQQR
jgi:hypothetical protein